MKTAKILIFVAAGKNEIQVLNNFYSLFLIHLKLYFILKFLVGSFTNMIQSNLSISHFFHAARYLNMAKLVKAIMNTRNERSKPLKTKEDDLEGLNHPGSVSKNIWTKFKMIRRIN